MGATILVADDAEAIVEFLAMFLEGEGHTVRRAGDGAGALAQLARGGIDLLIADDRMPGVSGLALLARMRAEPALAVPTILISASPGTRPPPPTAFLPKPFALDDLLALVGTLLARGGAPTL